MRLNLATRATTNLLICQTWGWSWQSFDWSVDKLAKLRNSYENKNLRYLEKNHSRETELQARWNLRFSSFIQLLTTPYWQTFLQQLLVKTQTAMRTRGKISVRRGAVQTKRCSPWTRPSSSTWPAEGRRTAVAQSAPVNTRTCLAVQSHIHTS